MCLILGIMSNSTAIASVGTTMDPKEVVSRFMELDALGIERKGKVLDEMNKLSSVYVPERDVHLSVDDQYMYKTYKIVDTVVEGDKATVVVEYKMIGWVLEYFDYNPDISKRSEKFTLIKMRNNWQIKTWPWILYWKPVLKEVEKRLEADKNTKREWKDKELSEFYRIAKKWRVLERERSIREIRLFAANENPKIPEEEYTVNEIINKLATDTTIDLEKQENDLIFFLMNRDLKELRLIRNSIFAKKNYKFKDRELVNYYEKVLRNYRPQYSKVKLSSIETKNVNLLVNLEKLVKSRASAN